MDFRNSMSHFSSDCSAPQSHVSFVWAYARSSLDGRHHLHNLWSCCQVLLLLRLISSRLFLFFAPFWRVKVAQKQEESRDRACTSAGARDNAQQVTSPSVFSLLRALVYFTLALLRRQKLSQGSFFNRKWIF